MGISLVFLAFGIVLMQTGEYVGHCLAGKRRRRRTSALVFFVFAMCITNCVLVTHLNWFRLEDLPMLAPDFKRRPRSLVLAFTAMNASVASSVMIFFAHKIWVLGRQLRYFRRIVGVVCTISALALLHTVTAAMIIAERVRTAGNATTPLMDAATGVFFASAMAADMCITAALTALLAHYREQSAFRATRRVLRTITRHTLESGALTTVLAGIGCALFFTQQADGLQDMVRWITTQLHAMVLLSSINRACHTASNPEDSDMGLTGFDTAGVFDSDHDEGPMAFAEQNSSSTTQRVSHVVRAAPRQRRRVPRSRPHS